MLPLKRARMFNVMLPPDVTTDDDTDAVPQNVSPLSQGYHTRHIGSGGAVIKKPRVVKNKDSATISSVPVPELAGFGSVVLPPEVSDEDGDVFLPPDVEYDDDYSSDKRKGVCNNLLNRLSDLPVTPKLPKMRSMRSMGKALSSKPLTSGPGVSLVKAELREEMRPRPEGISNAELWAASTPALPDEGMEFFSRPRIVPKMVQLGLRAVVSLDLVNNWDVLRPVDRRLSDKILSNRKPKVIGMN